MEDYTTEKKKKKQKKYYQANKEKLQKIAGSSKYKY